MLFLATGIESAANYDPPGLAVLLWVVSIVAALAVATATHWWGYAAVADRVKRLQSARVLFALVIGGLSVLGTVLVEAADLGRLLESTADNATYFLYAPALMFVGVQFLSVLALQARVSSDTAAAFAEAEERANQFKKKATAITRLRNDYAELCKIQSIESEALLERLESAMSSPPDWLSQWGANIDSRFYLELSLRALHALFDGRRRMSSQADAVSIRVVLYERGEKFLKVVSCWDGSSNRCMEIPNNHLKDYFKTSPPEYSNPVVHALCADADLPLLIPDIAKHEGVNGATFKLPEGSRTRSMGCCRITPRGDTDHALVFAVESNAKNLVVPNDARLFDLIRSAPGLRFVIGRHLESLQQLNSLAECDD